MKQQVVVIHGGDPKVPHEKFLPYLRHFKVDADDFKTSYGWKVTLQKRLGKKFEVFNPKMPNDFSARYIEWEIWFDKLVPFLKDSVILVGHSLGGIFLVKYLSENKIPVTIKAVLLVATPYRHKDGTGYVGDFGFKKNLDLFDRQAEAVILYQSKDDPLVPFSHLSKYKRQFPKAMTRIFTDREHLWQKEFPEIVKDIKALQARSL